MESEKKFYIPFNWEDRRVVLHDKIWFFPPEASCDVFRFPGWQSSELFGNTHPVHIEYCSGNGSWVIEKAQQNPHINWLAVEKRYERVRKIWKKIKNNKLDNLVVAFGEGYSLTERYIPSESVENIFINFPDPWPKRRHAKHRLLCPAFINELARILKENGQITFVTDDERYSAITVQQFQEHAGFSSLGPPHYTEPPASYGTSFFEELFRSKGKQIRMHLFEKQKQHH